MHKKGITEIVITAVLIIILFFLSINSLKKSKHPGVLLKAETRPSAAGRSAKIHRNSNFKKMEDATKDLRVTRDPFVAGAPTLEAASACGLSLAGIVWDKDKPLAIINETILKTGDRIEPYEIIEIRQKSVILSDGINELTLTLGEEK